MYIKTLTKLKYVKFYKMYYFSNSRKFSLKTPNILKFKSVNTSTATEVTSDKCHIFANHFVYLKICTINFFVLNVCCMTSSKSSNKFSKKLYLCQKSKLLCKNLQYKKLPQKKSRGSFHSHPHLYCSKIFCLLNTKNFMVNT